MRFILASKSPRRKELLKTLLDSFECIPAVSDEVFDHLPIDEALYAVARHKALEIFVDHPDALVLGADTIVVDGNEILQKPKDAQEAFRTLRQLSGRWHEVKTGMVLFVPVEHSDLVREYGGVQTTRVKFRDLTDAEIEAYVRKGSCLDKAGSYGIQDVDFVERIEGSYSNVVGLPLETLESLLRSIGLKEEDGFCALQRKA